MNDLDITIERVFDDSVDGIARFFEILIKHSQKDNKSKKKENKEK